LGSEKTAMDENFNLHSFAKTVSSLFFMKNKVFKPKQQMRKSYMHLNFFLIINVLSRLEKSFPTRMSSALLLDKKIHQNKDKHNRTTTCTHSLYLKRDLCFISASCAKNPLLMKKIVAWKLTTYVKNLKNLYDFFESIQLNSNQACKKHFIKLLEEQKYFSPEELEEEWKRQEKNWQLYQTRGHNGPNNISPI